MRFLFGNYRIPNLMYKMNQFFPEFCYFFCVFFLKLPKNIYYFHFFILFVYLYNFLIVFYSSFRYHESKHNLTKESL